MLQGPACTSFGRIVVSSSSFNGALVPLVFRSTVSDLVIAALAGNKQVLRNPQVQWRVDTAHGDAGPVVTGDRGLPEQGGAARRAEAALNLGRRLVPGDRLFTMDTQCASTDVHGYQKTACLLAALRAVAGFRRALERFRDFKVNCAAKTTSTNHLGSPHAPLTGDFQMVFRLQRFTTLRPSSYIWKS